MAFADLQDVRDQTTISLVSSLSDTKIDFYIERANAYLRRVTKKDYRGETDVDLLSDLKRVTVLLVEYLWFINQPEVKEGNLAGIDTERIGSYSYNKSANATGTGNPELDALLSSLVGTIGLNLFSVSGPSRGKIDRFNEHAYVTDIEE
ncbi:hypothetical protein COJ96_10905 [Bacillus sp. AFS073361]|uniref:DUF3199 family protein n=1 Tax=Bacillus sp. AFS073361 TaxID=2033511 RepID=UPI000BF7DB9C|nr:DUF3199 family protein [Bacillus sp. AFS073361]PFP29405.1 hypothetical protein COJ96_10905 [Bacillus sp. AFS073361]